MARALVTGAGQRLGRALALELARQGHDVAVHYATSQSGAIETAAEIQAIGQKAVTLQADLLNEGQLDSLVTRAADSLGGPLSCLVNNASIFEYDTIETATRDSWHRHMGSNLRAPFVLTQNFSRQAPAPLNDPNREPRSQALVVNMIDQRVRKLTPEYSTYTLAKSALWTLTQTAAQALAPNIRVNGIGPGPTMRGGRQSETEFGLQRARTVLNRGANSADITDALRYFLNAPSVTGQLICTDGGQHLAWQTPDIVGLE